MITLIYLAAPLSSRDLAARCLHMERAQALRDAIERDPACMVYLPHERLARPHGYPNDDETSEIRRAGLSACMDALARIAASGGALHVLSRRDGTLSPGCVTELAHWRGLSDRPPVIWHEDTMGWRSECGREVSHV